MIFLLRGLLSFKKYVWVNWADRRRLGVKWAGSKQSVSMSVGEVGRVYYINTKLTLIDGEEWTRSSEFTLNPDYGSTVEEMLKRTNEIPNQMKDQFWKKASVWE